MYEKPDKPSRLAVEQQETDPWEKTELLTLTTGDVHYDYPNDSIEFLKEQYAVAIECLLRLNAGTYESFPDFLLSTLEKRSLRKALLILSDDERYGRLKQALISPKASPLTAGQILVTRHDTARIQSIEGKKNVPLDQQIQDSLLKATRPHLLSLSDSHRTTGSIFEAMDEVWTYRPEETAVFCVDHHTDTYFSRTPDLHKSTVMRWLLEKQLVGAIGVMGTHPIHPEDCVPGADFITGGQLYTENHKPDQEALILFLTSLFSKWQKSGIKQVYLSIDLDGLRIDTQSYTATDYSHINRLFDVISRLNRFHLSCEEGTDSLEARGAYLREIIDRINTHGQPYFGIPAAWITHAVRLIKDPRFDFSLGVTDQKTGKKIIGDVVEFSGRDLGGRTSRLALTLIEKLAQLGQ